MTKKKMIPFIFVVTVIAAFFFIPMLVNSQLASTLGISSYAAKKVIDIVATAGNVAAVVGIVAAVVGGGGIGVALLATAKSLVQKYGRAYAAAW